MKIFKLKRKTIFFLTLIALLVLILSTVLLWKKTCPKYGCINIKGIEQFRTQEVYRDDNNIYRALLSNNNDYIRIEVKSAVQERLAEENIQGEIVRMKALFENALSPYPGELSNEIQCSKEFKPVLKTETINNTQVSYFTGFLNQRMVFGSCVKDQAIYKGILTLFYCPAKKQLFQLEIIAPADSFNKAPEKYQQMLESVSCTN